MDDKRDEVYRRSWNWVSASSDGYHRLTRHFVLPETQFIISVAPQGLYQSSTREHHRSIPAIQEGLMTSIRPMKAAALHILIWAAFYLSELHRLGENRAGKQAEQPARRRFDDRDPTTR